jgi:hypothetical protein
MPEKWWKQKERRIARKYFGVERNPLDGSDQADCENGTFVVEMFNQTIPTYVKKHLASKETLFRKVPDKLLGEFNQAIIHCPPTKVPICVWTEKKKNDEDGIVIFNKSDFVDNFKATKDYPAMEWWDTDEPEIRLVIMTLKDVSLWMGKI